LGHDLNVFDADICWSQRVEAAPQPVQIRLLIAEEIGYLSQCVDTCVSSPGTGHSIRHAEKGRYRLLQNRLNGGPVRLHLPAVVICPVVLNR
jgi:hypothetical protein